MLNGAMLFLAYKCPPHGTKPQACWCNGHGARAAQANAGLPPNGWRWCICCHAGRGMRISAHTATSGIGRDRSLGGELHNHMAPHHRPDRR